MNYVTLFQANKMTKKVNGKLTDVSPFIGLAVGSKISQLIIGLLRHEPDGSTWSIPSIKATVPGNDLGTAIRSMNTLCDIYQIHGYLVQIMPQYWDHNSSIVMRNEYQQTLREFAYKEDVETHIKKIMGNNRIPNTATIDDIFLAMIEHGCRPSIKGLIEDIKKGFILPTPLIKGMTKNITPEEQRSEFDDSGFFLEDLGYASCVWGVKIGDVETYNALWRMIDSKNLHCVFPSIKKGDLNVSKFSVAKYNESRLTKPLDLEQKVPTTLTNKLGSRVIFTEISMNGSLQIMTGIINTPTGEYELKFTVRVWRALCGLNYQEESLKVA